MNSYGLVAACLLVLAAMGAMAAPPTAKAFVQSIYAPFGNDKLSPLTREKVYSKMMLKLMAADSDLAGGEAGYLNADPLCSCQDYVNFRPDISVTEKADKATANVKFILGKNTHKNLTLKLVQEKNQWRVDDVLDANTSLQAALRKAAADARK